jgi:hypothetical protein
MYVPSAYVFFTILWLALFELGVWWHTHLEEGVMSRFSHCTICCDDLGPGWAFGYFPPVSRNLVVSLFSDSLLYALRLVYDTPWDYMTLQLCNTTVGLDYIRTWTTFTSW